MLEYTDTSVFELKKSLQSAHQEDGNYALVG